MSFVLWAHGPCIVVPIVSGNTALRGVFLTVGSPLGAWQAHCNRNGEGCIQEWWVECIQADGPWEAKAPIIRQSQREVTWPCSSPGRKQTSWVVCETKCFRGWLWIWEKAGRYQRSKQRLGPLYQVGDDKHWTLLDPQTWKSHSLVLYLPCSKPLLLSLLYHWVLPGCPALGDTLGTRKWTEHRSSPRKAIEAKRAQLRTQWLEGSPVPRIFLEHWQFVSARWAREQDSALMKSSF
jgi:hypothetical protein